MTAAPGFVTTGGMDKVLTLYGIEAGEFWDGVTDAMRLQVYNDDGSDYICAFCLTRPRFNHEAIRHDQHCFGQKLLNSLQKP